MIALWIILGLLALILVLMLIPAGLALHYHGEDFTAEGKWLFLRFTLWPQWLTGIRISPTPISRPCRKRRSRKKREKSRRKKPSKSQKRRRNPSGGPLWIGCS